MPRCEYSYCITLLPCNQFHNGGGAKGWGGGTALTGGVARGPPLRTASGRACILMHDIKSETRLYEHHVGNQKP